MTLVTWLCLGYFIYLFIFKSTFYENARFIRFCSNEV